LTDDNSQVVRHNAALSLAKIGPDAESARAAMTKSLENESIYVRGNARLALARIGET
jgi:HEAT repeat protein